MVLLAIAQIPGLSQASLARAVFDQLSSFHHAGMARILIAPIISRILLIAALVVLDLVLAQLLIPFVYRRSCTSKYTLIYTAVSIEIANLF